MSSYSKLITPILLKLTLINIFLNFLLFLQVFGQTVIEKEQSDGAAAEKIFTVRLRFDDSDFPGRELTIRVHGEKKNVTNDFGENQEYVEFLGIPYSKPPVNNLRFQRPTLNKLKRDFTADRESPPCPQIAINGGVVGEEDCLYLNIYAPQEISTNKLPVLVWFHGESLEKSADGILSLFSSGSPRELEPEIFIQNKILVVTPQYRLGSLGFLTTVNEDLSGNMGLFDQLASLEWIQKFISEFGGDPNQVTIMGHGSAAIGVGLLATSDLAKGLFHRIIMMGGSALSPLAVDTTPKATYAEIALENGCPAFPTLRFVLCIQKKSFRDLIRNDAALLKEKHIGKVRIPHPVIQRDPDGRFLPPILSRLPLSSLTSGNFEHVPLIIGVTSAEMSGFLPNLAGKETREVPTSIFTNGNILNQFIRAVLSRSSSNPDLLADLVSFEYFAGLNVSDPARQEQAVDIVEEIFSDYLFHIPALHLAKLWSRYAPVHFYVFDYVANNSPMSEVEKIIGKRSYKKNRREVVSGFSPSLQASHGSDLQFLMEGHEGSAKDREIWNILMDFWVSFIHKGSPLHSGLDWPQFREDTSKYLMINEQVQVSSGFRNRKDYLWNTLLEKTNNHACSSPVGLGPRRRTNQNIFEFRQGNEKLGKSVLLDNENYNPEFINDKYGYFQ